jgi:hypothetical protein
MEDLLGSETWIIISVAIIGPAIGMWIRNRFFGKKKFDVNAVAICPHCHSEVPLEKVKNFICGGCEKSVVFFDSLDGTNPKKELLFTCKKCGADNFKGLKYCPGCGEDNKE